ncbi:MAG TPA: hypothetical protein ENL10_04560 [Candidatus Cloacimonetes bacterium]|nr:hypothetical protein [Candidatus Cloacimonadota bacterium]
MKPKRKSIPRKIQLAVWFRDNWTCKYCGTPVIFSPTLKLLNELSPNHGYYHQHGKATEMLHWFQWKWASVDHIEPFSSGGSDLIENFTTACWECNLNMNDTPVSKKLKPIRTNENSEMVNWDGLSSLYVKLSKKNDSWVKLLKEY